MDRISQASPSYQSPVYIDLFAGCGGLSLGLHNAGWKGLFAIEKSPLAFRTLQHNLIERNRHFDWPIWLPLRNHDIDDVIARYTSQLKELQGKVDLIAGGPPCQGFSTAGKRREDDERNALIKSYLRFVSYVRPKVIFFENVKGFTLKFMKNSEKGLAYSSYVTDVLDKFGYNVRGQIVDFSEYGIPQKRTRFILVGIRRDLELSLNNDFFNTLFCAKSNFLKARGLNEITKLEEAISDLLFEHGTVPCPDRKKFKSGIYSKPNSNYQIYMRRQLIKYVPDSHSFVNHRKKTISKFELLLKNGRRNRTICNELKKCLNVNKHTIIPLDSESPGPTLTTLPDDYIHYSEPRILTVREYARIQSFPDWFEFKGKYTTGGQNRINEVPRYSQIGNAIPPLFAEQVGEQLKAIIG